MANIDFSLLDVPRTIPIDDPEDYLRAAIAWHFGEDTGSPFWLRTAKTLAFDPLIDVKSFADLRLFPNLVNELRGVAVEELAQCILAGGDADEVELQPSASATTLQSSPRH